MAAQARRPFTFWVISDLHYLSPRLYHCDSVSFQSLLQRNDGKMIEQMPAIMKSLTRMAKREQPDAILIPGDLTLNGEYESLLDLRECLRSIHESGTEILVIPGNHDIAFQRAARLTKETAIPAKAISQNDFAEVMGEFGLKQARFRAADSFSYICQADGDLWIMALDANREHAKGEISNETLAWAESMLEQALSQNIRVITVTHQNIIPQSRYFMKDYVLNNRKEVRRVLEKGGVTLNLSGHSHLQHISVCGDFTDICTECAAVSPLSFSVLSIEADRIHAVYSRRLFETDRTAAEIRLDRTIERMVAPAVDNPDIPSVSRKQMVEFAIEVCARFYTGELNDSSPYIQSPEWNLWKTFAGNTFWYEYLETILAEFVHE